MPCKQRSVPIPSQCATGGVMDNAPRAPFLHRTRHQLLESMSSITLRGRQISQPHGEPKVSFRSTIVCTPTSDRPTPPSSVLPSMKVWRELTDEEILPYFSNMPQSGWLLCVPTTEVEQIIKGIKKVLDENLLEDLLHVRVA